MSNRDLERVQDLIPRSRFVVDETSWQFVWRNLNSISFWAGIIKFLEFATGIALLSVTTLQIGSPSITTTLKCGESSGGIESTTNVNIVSLITSILTPILNAGVFSWDSIPWLKDSPLGVYKMVLGGSEVLQFAVWLTTATWYTVKYTPWSCSNTESLLRQYGQEEALANYTMIIRDTYIFNSTTMASDLLLSNLTGITNATQLDLASLGARSLLSAFNVSTITVSDFDESVLESINDLVSQLSYDCTLKRGTAALSWFGVGLFIISIVLVAWSWYRSTHKKPVIEEYDHFLPFSIVSLSSDNSPPPPTLPFLSQTTLVETLHDCLDNSIYSIPTKVLIESPVSYCLHIHIYFIGFEHLFYLDLRCARNYETIGDRVQTTVSLEQPASPPVASRFHSNHGTEIGVQIQYEGRDTHPSNLQKLVFTPIVDGLAVAYIQVILKGRGVPPRTGRGRELVSMVEQLRDMMSLNSGSMTVVHEEAVIPAPSNVDDKFDFEKEEEETTGPKENLRCQNMSRDISTSVSFLPDFDLSESTAFDLNISHHTLQEEPSSNHKPPETPRHSRKISLSNQRAKSPHSITSTTSSMHSHHRKSILKRSIDETVVASEEGWSRMVVLRSREEGTGDTLLRSREGHDIQDSIMLQHQRDMDTLLRKMRQLAEEERIREEVYQRSCTVQRRFKFSRSLLFPEEYLG